MRAKKKVCEIKGAWLITWKFHSPDEEELLKSLGIKDKIIDIIDSHKTFDYIADHMKRIYKILEGTYFDKVALSKCGKHKREREKVFFTPYSDSYMSGVYRDLVKFVEQDIHSKGYERAREKWKKYPKYISIGHNSSIYARKVRDIKVFVVGNDLELVEWKEPLVDGKWKQEEYLRQPFAMFNFVN